MRDSNLQEIQKETFFTILIVMTIVGATLLYILLLGLQDGLFDLDAYWWLPSSLVLLTCAISYKLYKRDYFRPAAYIFIGGLIISVNSFALWPNSDYRHAHIYLLILVVALAGVLIDPGRAAQAAAFAVVVTVGWAIYLNGAFSWQILKPLLMPLGMTCAMAIISWLNSNQLITTAQWALYSQRRTEQRSQELFESQQELQKAYQLLETTNYRLKQAEVAATEASELKTRFIRNLSHELRTPLSAIINFSYILSQGYHGQVTKEQSDYLMRVHDSGELLLEIVNDLLDLAKIESGQMSLFLEVIDVADVGVSVMNTISGVVADKPIELRQEIEDNLPKVKCDATRLRQVLMNLLGNAAKYTDEGTITLRMACNDETYVHVSVVDTGIGIKKKDFEAIFEEFQQTEEAFALRKVGTGLGLPISKKFVELQGGRLWVESEFGKGSTFHFTVPIVLNPDDAAHYEAQIVDITETRVTNL